MGNYLTKLAVESKELLQSVEKIPTRTSLCSKEPTDYISADLTRLFVNLQKLALAYGRQGRNLKKRNLLKVVKKSLRFMMDIKGYNSK